jgi:hypothetical protein
VIRSILGIDELGNDELPNRAVMEGFDNRPSSSSSTVDGGQRQLPARGQWRNIEAGVLINDERFAQALIEQSKIQHPPEEIG